jgi:hypothetical protein
MRRSLKLKLRARRVLYDEVCAKAREAFSESRFRDALAIYEEFAKENPGVHEEEIQHRIGALKEYIEGHVERLQGTSPPSTPA